MRRRATPGTRPPLRRGDSGGFFLGSAADARQTPPNPPSQGGEAEKPLPLSPSQGGEPKKPLPLNLAEGGAAEVGQAAAEVPARRAVHAPDRVPGVELQLRRDAHPAGDTLRLPLDGVRGRP